MSIRSGRRTRRVVVVDESALAKRIGSRIREARMRLGVSQRALAGERFTAQYVSSLERGAVKPSMAALNYLAGQLHVEARELLDPPAAPWSRVEADLALASGDLTGAADRYGDLADSAPSPTTRGEALLGLAEARCRLNHGAEAIGPAAEAAELFERAGRRFDAAWAHYWLASAQYQTDNLTEARSLLEALLQQVRAGLDVEAGFKMRLLTSLAAVVGWSGDHQAALSYLEEGRGLIEALDPRVQAAYFYSLAQNYKQAGDMEAAVRAGTRSLALYEGLGARVETSVLHNHLALTHLRMGNLKRASKFADLAAAEADELGDVRAQAWVSETKGEIALAEGRYDAAVQLATRALELETEGASPETVLSARITAAKALRAQGTTEAAREAYESAVALARSGGSAARRRQVLAEYAEYLTEIGDSKAAIELYREAVS